MLEDRPKEMKETLFQSDVLLLLFKKQNMNKSKTSKQEMGEEKCPKYLHQLHSGGGEITTVHHQFWITASKQETVKNTVTVPNTLTSNTVVDENSASKTQ